jgi:hypothetical protein
VPVYPCAVSLDASFDRSEVFFDSLPPTAPLVKSIAGTLVGVAPVEVVEVLDVLVDAVVVLVFVDFADEPFAPVTDVTFADGPCVVVFGDGLCVVVDGPWVVVDVGPCVAVVFAPWFPEFVFWPANTGVNVRVSIRPSPAEIFIKRMSTSAAY